MPLLLIAMMVLFTTMRHETAHALMAHWLGATINEIHLLPGIHPELGFYFGYVEHSGVTSWWIEAAPYLADILTLVVALAVLLCLRLSRAWRMAVFFLGLISPLIDLAWGYAGGLWRVGSDVHDLLQALPPPAVHGAFLTALAACVLGLWLAHRRTRS